MCYFLQSAPKERPIETDLVIEPIVNTPQTMEALNQIDHDVLGYERPADHVWLLQDEGRAGYTFKRADQIVGYGYVGGYNGPFALLDSKDFPVVLAFAEGQAAKHQRGFDIPVQLINEVAVDCLLSRGSRAELEFTC